jgi:hypothetical protein
MELNEVIRKFSQGNERVLLCTVKAIDAEDNTCDLVPVHGGAELTGVRLMPIAGAHEKGLLVVPAVDSFVLVLFLDKSVTDAFVVMASDLSSISLKLQNDLAIEIDEDSKVIFTNPKTSITIDTDGNVGIEAERLTIKSDNIEFNDGQNGPVVKWTELKAQLEKVKQFITATLGIVSGSPLPQPPNAPNTLWVALKAALSSTQTPIFENLEDEKIKH